MSAKPSRVSDVGDEDKQHEQNSTSISSAKKFSVQLSQEDDLDLQSYDSANDDLYEAIDKPVSLYSIEDVSNVNNIINLNSNSESVYDVQQNVLESDNPNLPSMQTQTSDSNNEKECDLNQQKTDSIQNDIKDLEQQNIDLNEEELYDTQSQVLAKVSNSSNEQIYEFPRVASETPDSDNVEVQSWPSQTMKKHPDVSVYPTVRPKSYSSRDKPKITDFVDSDETRQQTFPSQTKQKLDVTLESNKIKPSRNKYKLSNISKSSKVDSMFELGQTKPRSLASDDRQTDLTNNLESISAKVHSINSIYDSNDKLIYSAKTSDYEQFVGEQISFWKTVIVILLLPYALVGVPVVSIYRLSIFGEKQITRPLKWLKYLFSNLLSIVANGFELVLLLIQNLYIIISLLGATFTLLESGKLTEESIKFLFHLYELLPLVIGFNVVWFRGYRLTNIIKILDNKIPTRNSKSPFRYLSTILIVTLCAILSICASTISFEWKDVNYYATESRSEFYLHLLVRIYILFFMILYITTLCVKKSSSLKDDKLIFSKFTFQGVHYKTFQLNNYIRELGDDISTITTLEFQKIKNIFKLNADLVCRVNQVFNVLISDVLVILFISILKDLFHVFLQVTVLDTLKISAKNGSRPVNDELISKTSKWILLDTVSMLGKVLLILFSIRKVRQVNKQIRLILLNLHYLASEYVEKPTQIYQSV